MYMNQHDVYRTIAINKNKEETNKMERDMNSLIEQLDILPDISPLFNDVGSLTIIGYSGINFESIKECVKGAIGSNIKSITIRRVRITSEEFEEAFAVATNRTINPLTEVKLHECYTMLDHNSFNQALRDHVEVLDVTGCSMYNTKDANVLAHLIR